MELFENEDTVISKIHTVEMYEYKNEYGKKHYNVKLNTYELIFFVSGERRTHFAGKNLYEMPNSVRYLPKGVESGKYTVDIVTPGCCIDIYFDTSDPMPDFAMNLKDMNILNPLFNKMYNVWNSKKTGYYAEAMSIFYDIIKKIKIHSEKYNTSSQAKKIAPSYNYMLAHFFDHGFDYKTMCGKSGLSYDYFKELFIKQYGVSPVKYVTALRIEKSKELLITKLYSITEIAQMCGFENVYYFSAVFKKQVGVSPKNYKLI